MAKNRIKNIDEIVTQAGTIVDLDNIQASGGGSTTTVNAGNLAISKTETSNEIGYHFNVAGSGSDPFAHAADGHSSSATSMMVINGKGGNPSNAELKQFSSASLSVDHGSLNYQKFGVSAASNGTEVFITQGRHNSNSQYVNSSEKKQFSSNATATVANGLTEMRAYMNAGSDGTLGMFCGGWVSSEHNTCDTMQFTDGSVAVDHGDLTYGQHGGSAASDGSKLMVINGGTPVAYLKRCQMKNFSDSSVCEDHGEMLDELYGNWAVSDGSLLISAGGWDGAQRIKQCELKQFSDSSVAVVHGELGEVKAWLQGASDGTQAMFGGGMEGSTGNFIDSCDMKQFSSSATSTYGSLPSTRSQGAGASGTV